MTAELILRPATMQDVRKIFEWRNAPEIVMRSTTGRPVSWDEHQAWFGETINGTSRRLFVLVRGDDELGQVRFDRKNGMAVISVYLLERFTGRGLGIQAIRRGCERIAREWGVRRIIAHVQDGNLRGKRAFAKCGFVEQPVTQECPPNHRRYVVELSA
jgi:RimJ/RimL family protein N-acetyltransferase